MKSRRTFITAVTALTSAAVCMPKAIEAGPSTGAAIQVAAIPAPSAAARATAENFRTFDAALSDAEIATIARTIDANAGATLQLNPKHKRLRNSDEPVTRFAAGRSSSKER